MEGYVDWSWPCIHFPVAELSAHPLHHPPQQTPSPAEHGALWGFSFWKDSLEKKTAPTVHKRDKRKWSRERGGKGEMKEARGVCSRCVWRVGMWGRGLQTAEIVIANSSYSPDTWKKSIISLIQFSWFTATREKHKFFLSFDINREALFCDSTSCIYFKPHVQFPQNKKGFLGFSK